MSLTESQLSVAIEPTPVRIDQMELLNMAVQLKLVGNFAEIGTYRASFAYRIMETCNPSQLFCVDPYEQYDDFKDAINNEKMDDLFSAAQKYMEPYKSSTKFLRMRSSQAAQLIPDGSLDFVYIDANHSYPYVKQDIELWYPKVRAGGMFCGDDAVDNVDDSQRNADGDIAQVWTRNAQGEPQSWGHYGVLKAIREFVDTHKLEFHQIGSQFIIFKGMNVKLVPR